MVGRRMDKVRHKTAEKRASGVALSIPTAHKLENAMSLSASSADQNQQTVEENDGSESR